MYHVSPSPMYYTSSITSHVSCIMFHLTGIIPHLPSHISYLLPISICYLSYSITHELCIFCIYVFYALQVNTPSGKDFWITFLKKLWTLFTVYPESVVLCLGRSFITFKISRNSTKSYDRCSNKSRHPMAPRTRMFDFWHIVVGFSFSR